MLRSLVGSEMCIRDSPHSVHEILEFNEAKAHLAYAGGDMLLMPSLFEPCLLYTSDAADDLLCVDLGGRRIIKKKTTNKPENL